MLTIAGKTFSNRLILGTGKYKDFATMKACYEAARSEMVTLAVRRFDLNAKGEDCILNWIPKDIHLLPNTAGCFTLEDTLRVARLAREAGSLAVRRHAGSLREVFLPEGRRRYAQGKDLTEAGTLIATGGALTRLEGRRGVLAALRDLNTSGRMLYPKPGALRVLSDRRYLMAALGVLSREHPQAALHMLLDSLAEETLS